MMPIVKIFVRRGKPAKYRKALLDSVHKALVNSIKIPDHDRSQMLFEFEKSGFEAPANKTDNVTMIEIIMFKGRSAVAKKRLYAEIVSNLARKPGIVKDDILVILHEEPLENWGVRGNPADEVDLGFRIDV